MKKPKPETIFILLLLLVGVLFLVADPHKSHRQSGKAPPTTTLPADAVVLPGVVNAFYEPGLADRFLASTNPTEVCDGWRALPEAEKRGLAYVSAKAVPNCADPSYARQAAAEHSQHPLASDSGQTAYFDLGQNPVPQSPPQTAYSCDYLKKLTASNYDIGQPPPYTYNGGEQQRRDFDAWYDQQAEMVKIHSMYTNGGWFAAGCYPPGAIFGPNYRTISFYPNTPVASLVETPVPVFNLEGCNICDKGAVYVIAKGDTLGDIAECSYGDRYESRLIQAVNRISDADLTNLQIGQIIRLPGLDKAKHCPTNH